MESAANNQLMRRIGLIWEETKDCKLEEAMLDKLDGELATLGTYLTLNKTQTLFFCLIFGLNFSRNSVCFSMMIDYLACSPFRFYEFLEDMEILEKKGILQKEAAYKNASLGESKHYSINPVLTEAILKNLPLPELTKGSSDYFEHVLDLLEALYKMGSNVAEGYKMNASEMFAKFGYILVENTHLPLIRNISSLGLANTENFLFLYLIWKYLNGRETVEAEKAANGMFDGTSEKLRFKQDLMAGQNELIKMELIDVENGFYINDIELKFTKKALLLLQDSGLPILVKKKLKNIVLPDKIPAKELFFNGSEKNQLQMLVKLLDNNKLKRMQDHLARKELPKGVTVLFYGCPGTGKTEFVYQLAKQTNRAIMKVDISQSKSMWFGESEKVIKNIFDDYHLYAKECKQSPILLFNEADAIIAKRKDSSSSTVAQTENTIQNIILDELDNFDGIFMATTNLVKNIDTAFDRRFLFKVEFPKPDVVAKAMIWQSKLPWLLPQDCQLLAKEFDFSGGQIDNVVRKIEVETIINDNLLTFELVNMFCNQELMLRENKVKVGF